MESSPYASPASTGGPVHSTASERGERPRQQQQEQHQRQRQEFPAQQPGHKAVPLPQHMASVPRTPQAQTRIRPPASAPQARCSRTHFLLASPEAARRSKESLETFKVARTLKEGLLRLKARADSHSTTPSASMAAWRRPMRTFSATTTSSSSSTTTGAAAEAAAGAVALGRNNAGAYVGGTTLRRPLLRHHSEIPRRISTDSPDRNHFRLPSAASPSASLQGVGSPKSHPAPPHHAYPSPQRRLVGRTTSDGLLLSSASTNARPPPYYGRQDNNAQTPDALSGRAAAKEPSYSAGQNPMRTAATLTRNASGTTGMPNRPTTPPDEGSQHSEVAEAAEAMILFMKSETSSQNDHLSTSSFSPPHPNRQSPAVSPAIPAIPAPVGPAAHRDALGGCDGAASVLEHPATAALLGGGAQSSAKRSRSVSQTPSCGGDLSLYKRVHVDN
ncbi:hypothetical protein H4217_002529 [Coemansia sp. RSA 1939]|nr:hypothetical protein H4217_002529 [Coemansia sp. RSA 1939]KAJ2612388.1 hypothetical protein EV177_003027 [Coemansia sp. RSA 1804]KAJ2654864.1 hypothetical protein GGH99_007259 [Coemansia sp. RSA 1285]